MDAYLTASERQRLKALAAESIRPLRALVYWLVAQELARPPHRSGTRVYGASSRHRRQAYAITLVISRAMRKKIDARAKAELWSASSYNAVSSAPIFSSDALPTNTALGPESFDVSSVTLLPPNSVVTSSSLTSLTLTAVPEPSSAALVVVGLLVRLVVANEHRARPRIRDTQSAWGPARQPRKVALDPGTDRCPRGYRTCHGR